jgi:hypothetical protein
LEERKLQEQMKFKNGVVEIPGTVGLGLVLAW